MSINKRVFLHDSDRVALQTLRAIPGFTQVLRAFMKVWDEENMHVWNMAQKVRISEEQLPEYYHMLLPICDKLGIDIPELYLELNPVANAYTTGDSHPAITITSGLLETIPEELLPTVLAHECGHIACHHVLYMTMGRWILDGTLSMMPLKIAETALTPINAAFAYWMRCSEFSADRAAILCDGTPDKMLEVCMRLAGMDKDVIHRANLFAFFNQAKEYKEYTEKNALNKLREFYQLYRTDHPVLSVRALEAKEWSESEDFIKSKQFFEAYNKDEKPKDIPINFSEKRFLGRSVDEVEKELIEFGFENVELVRTAVKGLLTKVDTVTNVAIDGSDKYKDGDWKSVAADVEVTFYRPFTEEEIIAMHPGAIKMLYAAKHFIGKPLDEVKAELEELGFYNIVVNEIRDITKEKDKNLGKVASILIERSPKFSKDDWIDEDALIEITYHETLKKEK